MIETIPVGGVRSTPQPTTRKELGKNEFLKLLTAQLTNQDPLNPMKPDEFAAQLAQFSSVEQLTQLNKAMAAQQAALDAAQATSQAGLAAALIGKQVVGLGNQVVVGAQGAPRVPVTVGAPGGTGTLTIKDASGRVVSTLPVGRLAAGDHQLTLPPNLPAGTYSYELTVTGADGKAVPVTTHVTGIVDGVRMQDGKVLLRVGALTIPMDKLTDIRPATVPAGSQ